MTNQAKGAPGWSGCPDPEQIAAHAEGRLTDDEARHLDEHIAGCADCYAVYSETLQFRLDEEKKEAKRVQGARALWERPLFKIAAAVLLATGVALSLYQLRDATSREGTPLVANLAKAMGDRRFIEPRLTGGFEHGRLIVLRSGETPKGLDAQSPAVLAAVAKIRERAEADTSPETLGALGITYLVSGDIGAAVKVLESATVQDPDNPRLLSDLAAAYFVRAARLDEPADIPKALEYSERAIALKDAPLEAWFNRALALEQLHLVDAARKAWDDYLERDSASGWADEARQHRDALPSTRQSTVEEDNARVRAALNEGPAAVDRLADEAPSLLRAYFDDVLLPAWAEAHLVGHPDEKVHLEHSRLVGDALLRTTGDAMNRDTAEALTAPPAAATTPDPLRSQALGLRAFREAKRVYDLQQDSCFQFRHALEILEAGGTPHGAWAKFQVIIACLYTSKPQVALSDLTQLAAVAEPRRYLGLLGRIRLVEGLIALRQGQLTLSLSRYRSAQGLFEATRDLENQAYMLTLVAEHLGHIGEGRAAWRERLKSLALLGDVTNPRRTYGILSQPLLYCHDERMPASALHFADALVRMARAWSRPAAVSSALVYRARIRHSLGADAEAAKDLLEGRRWIAQIQDKGLGEQQEADTDFAEGEILLRRQPEKAAQVLTESLSYFRKIAPFRLASIHLLLARAQMAQGQDEAAERELLAGIEAFERHRASLQDSGPQLSFFDQSSNLFDDMVRLQVAKRGDNARGLAFVERGHARQLVDALAGTAMTPLELPALERELAEGLALIYYLPLEDHLFAWVLSRGETHFIERPLTAAKLATLVAAQAAAIGERAPEDTVRREGARLFDELVRPFIPFLSSERALIFVPDGVLQPVAFAALWNRETGRYLVEDYLLALAPSGTAFVQASKRIPADGRPPRTAVVVGNPHHDRRLFASLPDLPGAQAEANEITALYREPTLLTGRAATKAAFLARLPDTEIVHYAGHATSGENAPAKARLLFAADPRTADSGALYLQELAKQSLPRTRVVVLAACRTGAGTVSRVEGALSLGRPFLAAGVPDVVASLWDIDDSVSRRFFVAFHRALQERGDPSRALRDVQVSFLRSQDPSLVHPASWAAFICMGGIHSDSLSKGELS
jgi:CHAT domain-containing protein